MTYFIFSNLKFFENKLMSNVTKVLNQYLKEKNMSITVYKSVVYLRIDRWEKKVALVK